MRRMRKSTMVENRPKANGRKSTMVENEPARIVQLRVDLLKPSPENDQLYRPVTANDPETRKLAASIREFGLKEPIVVTRDGYIISGHRRRLASQLAGLEMVPCRVEAVNRGDPEFLP